MHNIELNLFNILITFRYTAVMSYPANGPGELDLNEGDIIIVHKRIFY